MLQTGIASVSLSKHREGERERAGGMLQLAAGERELLARRAVPRGVLEESPTSPTHQGSEVAPPVGWRSFMNEPSLGNESQAQASRAFFRARLLSGAPAVLFAQRRMRGGGCPVVLMQRAKVASPLPTAVLQECDSGQARLWGAAGPSAQCP